MNARTAMQLIRGALAANLFRLALTVACIALGVALAGAVHTVHTSALAEVDRAAHALAGKADLEIRGPRNGFDDAVFAPVARLPGVQVASPVLEIEAPLAGRDEALRIVGIDALRAVRMQPAFVVDAAKTGANEASSILDSDALWLTPVAASRLKLQAGDDLRVIAGTRAIVLHVAGVLQGMQSAGELGVMDIAAAQWRFARVGSISRIDVRLRPGVDVAAFRAQAAKILPPGVSVMESASLAGRAAAITKAYRVNLDALSMVALATGAFLVFSTLALQAARRRSEFALLRALGITRRGLAVLLALEGASIGAVGAVIGTALGLAGSREVLTHIGSDLGAGFFSGTSAVFAPDFAALAFIAFTGIGMSVAGALWVARAVGRIEVAEALRDRAVDLPGSTGGGGKLALALFALGLPLLMLPPIDELPLGGYAAITLWLAASVLSVAPVSRLLLARLSPESPVAWLALAQVRDLPGHLAASVAGIVVSASLCVAMAIMVFSFRISLEDWLGGVVRADLYVQSGASGGDGYFSLEEQQAVARLAEVKSVEPLRFERITTNPDIPPLTLVARPVDEQVLAGFQAEPPGMPARGAEIPVWISEATHDLQRWKTGDRIELPIAGRVQALRVAGSIRDFARTWGAMIIPLDDYRRVTGDTRANDLAVFLPSGTDPLKAEAAIRRALPHATALAFEDSSSLKRVSLEIFDRTFAVTYALEAIAVMIGLAGITSSFAALAWSRRREFGVLRFLGLKRGEVLKLLAIEGVATGALGAAIGLVSGIAVSFVLVRVVNRQSFHWNLEVHWPVATLAILMAAIVALCAAGARASAALAVRDEAVRAVKDDA
ncbi:MAG: FtsX-like permease family protein [Usitatibacter sp.]